MIFTVLPVFVSFKACVFADVRGSLTSVPDYHGEKWQIIKGAIPSSEFSNSKFIKIRIKLDDLPPPFRKALLKRESKCLVKKRDQDFLY